MDHLCIWLCLAMINYCRRSCLPALIVCVLAMNVIGMVVVMRDVVWLLLFVMLYKDALINVMVRRCDGCSDVVWF